MSVKKNILAFLFVLIGTVLQAQDRLEPVSNDTERTPLISRIYHQEMWRLLNRRNAKWGVFIRPSPLSQDGESSLTYDARSHALVYTKVEGRLWNNVHKAVRVEKRVYEGNVVKEIIYSHEPQNYQEPSTKVCVLPIPNRMARNLKKLWVSAVKITEANDIMIFDGTDFVFFANGKKAAVTGCDSGWVRVPRLLSLEYNLEKAVKNKDFEALPALEQEAIELRKLFEKK